MEVLQAIGTEAGSKQSLLCTEEVTDVKDIIAEGWSRRGAG